MEAIDPSTGEVIATYDPHDADEVERRLQRSWDGFTSWRETAYRDRSSLLHRVAEVLEQRRDELAELMTREMGKPITASEAEIDKCAWVCRYEADHGPAHLAHDIVASDAKRSYVRFDPLGPLLAVMPWNFPFWQLFRAAAPSIIAGNSVVLKHASNVPGCALAIEDVFATADAPSGLFTTLLVGSGKMADVIADDRIRAVTLTGSVPAGRKVASAAGEALKPTVMELGGSDAFVVLADADVTKAVRTGVSSRLINNGQSCIAAKRFIVVEEVADAFVEGFVAATERSRVGDPMDRQTDVGPMARGDLRDELHDQVERSIQEGAELLTGGEKLDQPGFYYPPTVLDRVQPTMTAAAEETFGPVAAIIRVADEDEAIAVANGSDFGLGASIWTADLDRGERVAGRIEAGGVFVNQLVKSDPRVPFGGVKDSGYGRELGAYGIREFVNAKTVWLEG